jgi:hypothetical protein
MSCLQQHKHDSVVDCFFLLLQPTCEDADLDKPGLQPFDCAALGLVPIPGTGKLPNPASDVCCQVSTTLDTFQQRHAAAVLDKSSAVAAAQLQTATEHNPSNSCSCTFVQQQHVLVVGSAANAHSKRHYSMSHIAPNEFITVRKP